MSMGRKEINWLLVVVGIEEISPQERLMVTWLGLVTVLVFGVGAFAVINCQVALWALASTTDALAADAVP